MSDHCGVERWGPTARRQTLEARERVLGTAIDAAGPGRCAAEVRSEIASSWRRSQLNGIDPGRDLLLPYDPDREGSPRLLRAAQPVLERLSTDLGHTAVTLADSSSWLLWRAAADSSLIRGLDRIGLAP